MTFAQAITKAEQEVQNGAKWVSLYQDSINPIAQVFFESGTQKIKLEFYKETQALTDLQNGWKIYAWR